MPHTVTATIDLAALRHNLQQAKRLAPNSRIMAVIKADAYGHGIVAAAKALASADGLAVARLEEALTLRKQGINQRLLLLGSFLDSNSLALCADNNIDVAVHNSAGVDTLLASRSHKQLAVWLKHDSGMHRLGMNALELRSAHQRLSSCSHIGDMGLMTHFSAADDLDPHTTQQQTQSFLQATEGLTGFSCLANSAAIIQHPQTHLDWVRPGIMLYGANPLPPTITKLNNLELQPVMTLRAKIIAIRPIATGESAGYNERWTATRPTQLATIAIGYADGYPRHARNGTPVLINGQRAVLAGRVSMDLITVDISDCHEVNIGDEAILWGQGLPAEEIASYADTISYQLFTSVSKRVPRIYINTESIV